MFDGHIIAGNTWLFIVIHLYSQQRRGLEYPYYKIPTEVIDAIRSETLAMVDREKIHAEENQGTNPAVQFMAIYL